MINYLQFYRLLLLKIARFTNIVFTKIVLRKIKNSDTQKWQTTSSCEYYSHFKFFIYFAKLRSFKTLPEVAAEKRCDD